MVLDIPEDVSLRLEKLAKQQDADIGDLLRDMIERYDNEGDAKEKRRVTTADFARNALAAGLSSPHPVDTAERSVEIAGRYATWEDLLKSAREAGLASPEPVDTAARSREILQTEYTDYLVKRRLDNDDPRR
ncbi:MAG: hypothetical protein OXE46_07370 [Chloroflexi bacterium]|nr:hypothetical protein [Chloroflexota bacterium]